MAVVAVNLPAATASDPAPRATGPTASETHRAPRADALPAALSKSRQAALMTEANSRRTTLASSLHLGVKEKLVVKAVAEDRNGSTHLRYERTYAGLPVLGGDLVVHQDPAGVTTGVDRATRATITVPSTTAHKSAASANTSAVSAARASGAKHPSADTTRKVVWAAGGKPTLAWESVVGGFQDDGTPSKLHVVTSATTGAKLYQYQAIDTGVGNSEYVGQVDLTTALSDGVLQPHRRGARQPPHVHVRPRRQLQPDDR